MYCRNCGKELLPKAEICEGCSIRPPKGERFCNLCGVEVLPLAERCIKCGAVFDKPPRPKAKTVAVLLAVFLGYWTWLYTFKKNTWKFWAGLAVGQLADATRDPAVRPQHFFRVGLRQDAASCLVVQRRE